MSQLDIDNVSQNERGELSKMINDVFNVSQNERGELSKMINDVFNAYPMKPTDFRMQKDTFIEMINEEIKKAESHKNTCDCCFCENKNNPNYRQELLESNMHRLWD